MSCTYRNSYLETDEFLSTTLHSLGIVQVPIHIFATYIVLAKTPKEMRNIKTSMLLMHLVSAWADIYVTIFATPVFLFPATAGYVLGLLYDVIPTWLACYFGFVSVCFVGPALCSFFENRYNYLIRTDSVSKSRKWKRFCHNLFNIVFTILVAVPPFRNVKDVQGFREILHENFPCLPERIIQNPRLYYLNTDISTILVCIALFYAIIVTQAISLFIVTSVHLFKTKAQSTRTSRLQKKFFKALCLQLALPVFAIVVPGFIFFYIFATGNLNIILCNCAVVGITSHGACSAVMMLIVHKPYRRAVLRMMRIERREESPPCPKPVYIQCNN